MYSGFRRVLFQEATFKDSKTVFPTFLVNWLLLIYIQNVQTNKQPLLTF